MDKRPRALSAVLLLLVGVGCLCVAVVESPKALAADADRLEVKTLSGGGVRATAQVLFPAKPATVQALLTDYHRWPDLFETRMRVAELNVQDDVATVDLRIEHSLMPGEHRLVTESRTLPNGRFVTDLRAGDFKQYHRVWTLQPTKNENQTLAGFELVVEPNMMVPDWLVATVTRQELETHFRIVKQKVLERTRQ